MTIELPERSPRYDLPELFAYLHRRLSVDAEMLPRIVGVVFEAESM